MSPHNLEGLSGDTEKLHSAAVLVLKTCCSCCSSTQSCCQNPIIGVDLHSWRSRRRSNVCLAIAGYRAALFWMRRDRHSNPP